MKRILALLLVAALALSVATACAEGATITAEQAAQIAREAVRAQVTLTDEEFAALGINVNESTLDGHSGTVWSVVFVLNLDRSAAGIYWVTIDQRSGSVLTIDAKPNAYADAYRSNEGYKVLEQWLEEKGDMYYWPPEDLVEYFEKYADGMYKLPGEGDLARDDAIAIAKQYAISEWGLTAEYLDGLHVSANLTKGGGNTGTAQDDSMWYVYFVDENIRSDYDNIVAPHMVLVANPSGEVVGGDQGDTHGRG